MKAEKTWKTWTNMNNYTEKMKHCLIFSGEIFLSVLPMFKYSMTESIVSVGTTIIAKQTWTRKLRKHDVITVCSIEYVTTEIEHRSCYLLFVIFVVFATFVLRCWNIHQSIELTFFSHPVQSGARKHKPPRFCYISSNIHWFSSFFHWHT